MGEAIISAYSCIFEGSATDQAVAQATTGSADAVAVDPAAITSNPEAAQVLANIATKAQAEQQKVEQAQEELDKTTEAAKQTLAELQQEQNAKTTLNEQFNRFNYFDSEAAYKFIHAKDQNDEAFEVLYPNKSEFEK